MLLTVWMALQLSSAGAVTVSVRVNSGNDDAEELISEVVCTETVPTWK